jgi:Protein of unknown function (DUF3135)
MDNFDFDEWAMLARTAPDEFEQRRHDIIESLIANSGHVRRLRGLQWRIDLERKRARTPLQACVFLSSLMWDSFMDLNHALNTFVGNDCGSTIASSNSAQSAKIIQIPIEYKPHE